ncbi:hypothetical protein M378DRAFT_121005 [Amanita muscaria Koide BX008]|uniref:DAGKc domain-containing protein n=1 Tax=Amanita muscaria (strain Koide BX008) TaxID=946122 RepID=A0A0C2XGV1_AMAMK|nr:hypothetical protein M378DRAFT_121005 [Amanita muscaria Koide BX008]
MALIIYNPVCGSRGAKAFLDNHVLPLLAEHSVQPHNTFATEYSGHAQELVGNYINEVDHHEINVILLSGDGTLHEIINHLSSVHLSPPGSSSTQRCLNLIIVPCGTANALYFSLFPPSRYPSNDAAYGLQSLHTFLISSHKRPLKIAVNTLLSTSTSSLEVLSTVVTSTCMHASILHDSEELRQEYPGLDRFKIAGKKNSARWYSGRAKLFPSANSGTVQIFEPSLGRFIDHPNSMKENPVVELQGPFAYFLSVVNVDRLEPNYVIAPSVEAEPAQEGECFNLVIVRPSRSPAFLANDKSPHAFSPILWQVVNAPRKEGDHVYLRYTDEGTITKEGEGPPVVEYVRCGGWEWYPCETDSYAHLVCIDGAIHHLPIGGQVASSLLQERNGFRLAVYA